jgi:acyl-CoA carboxylase subunit beta
VNRVDHLIDPGSFEAVHDGLESRDPLGYPAYRNALRRARDKAGADESVVYGAARVDGARCIVAAFRFGFMGGSMGEVAGERIARAMEEARARELPFVLWTETGGARMQEGMRSLIQMPKVVSSRVSLRHAHLPFIAVLGNPTTGGVLASIAALADITFAVRGATVGFAGPRVAQSVTGRALSPGSHTAANTAARGLVDAVVDERDVRDQVGRILELLRPDEPAHVEAPRLTERSDEDPWAAVQAVRDTARPRAPDLIAAASDEIFLLRGDRAGGVDDAVVTALARVGGRRCVLIGLDHRHLPGPAAYRTARRALDVAESLNLPVGTLIDTRGADPGEESEAGGIAWEIARTYEAFLTASVPVLAIVIGEGGSGGALAFGAADRLVAYRDSIFSVIAPEGAAEILWRDAGRAEEAARLLRVTASDLARLGVCDDIVDEPLEAGSLRRVLTYHLDRLARGENHAEERRSRWRHREP